MKFAIDRYITGLEKEVSADEFYGKNIPRKSNRFFCPECGLQVYWVSKGGNQPNKFKHPPRTETSPECDKRVDGRSELYLYERVGLPVFLSRLAGNNFQLAISFPAVGSKILAIGATHNARVIIRGSGANRTVLINTNNFFPESATLVPVNFLPVDNGVFKIEVSPAEAYSRKWSNYAEGFTSTGAIFSYAETGGKKVHRDDSISPGRKYYVVARQFSCPYNEITCNAIGTLKLQNCTYQVYCMTVNVSLQNEQRYAQISDFLRYRFGVGLLEVAPEIIPLWPPVIERDVLIPTKDSQVFCAIASGNDDPSVYSYVGNQVLNVPVQNSPNGAKHICIQISTIDTILSVDRKYVGREIVFRKKEIDWNQATYEYAFVDTEGNVQDLDKISDRLFSKGGTIICNAKMDLYIGSTEHNYLRVPLRKSSTQLPTCQNAREVLLQVDGGSIVSLFLRTLRNGATNGTISLAWIQSQFYGEYIPIPRWAFKLIELIQKDKSSKLGEAIKARILNGKLPIGIIQALKKYESSKEWIVDES